MTFKHLLLAASLFPAALFAQHRTAQVAVFCINDFHGGLVQDFNKDIPGAAWMVQALDSLKQVYPNNITISAGDNFGGSFFYSATRAQSLMPQMFRDMGIEYSVPGNHAFDEGQELLADRWKSTDICPRSWEMKYICANMRKDGRIPDYCQPWAVLPVSLKEGGEVNVSVVGLITSNTPKQASARRLTGLSFDGNYSGVLDSIKHLPGYEEVEKANVRLLATHISTYWKDGEIAWSDPDEDNLYAFDRDDIDGIFSGHSHVEVAGIMPSKRPYPVVQGYWHGIYISMLLCDVDLETGRCIKVTPKNFKVNPHAQLGVKAARLQAQVEEQYQTTLFRGYPLSEVLTYAKDDIVHDRTQNRIVSRVGYLVTESYADAYRNAVKIARSADEETAKFLNTDIVVGVSHFGSIRAGFYKGNITVMDVGEALPFANPLKCYRYTGKQLKELLEYGVNECPLGRIQTSGVGVNLDKKGHVKSLYYTAADGTVTPIKDKTTFVLVADDYMTTGGDGYHPAFFPSADVINVQTAPSTDAFINYLKSQKEI